MKKDDKVKIIKWYIENKMITSRDIDEINDLKILEEIVRTEKPFFNNISRCNGCTSDNKDWCERCGSCIVWNWKKVENPIDNYRFSYCYWKKFMELDVQNEN